MRVGFASDLHVDIKGHTVPECPTVDVLILAGDISDRGRGLEWAYDTYKDHARHIIVVFGNHDFWGSKTRFQKILRLAREFSADKPNLHFLENDAVEIEGVWFVGATTWTDYRLGPNPKHLNMMIARDGMRDHDKIKWEDTSRGAFRKILPDDIEELNFESKQYIFNKLREIREASPEAITVVVTHHCPTPMSLDPAFHGSSLNPAYVNTWEYTILDQGPHLWIHGHVHYPHKYRIGNTLILCNPIGYPNQIRDSKIEVLEITVEDKDASVGDSFDPVPGDDG